MRGMRVVGSAVLAAVFLLASPALAQRRVTHAAAAARPAPVQVQVVTVLPTPSGMVVLLKTMEGEIYLPIWVGDAEALAIQLRLTREHLSRPLTHDLLDSVLRTLDARVVRVEVVDLRDGTFYGRVDVRAGRREHHLDARSSDSIAIALGSGAPIFVAKRVLDAAGMDRARLEREGYEESSAPSDRRHSL